MPTLHVNCIIEGCLYGAFSCLTYTHTHTHTHSDTDKEGYYNLSAEDIPALKNHTSSQNATKLSDTITFWQLYRYPNTNHTFVFNVRDVIMMSSSVELLMSLVLTLICNSLSHPPTHLPTPISLPLHSTSPPNCSSRSIWSQPPQTRLGTYPHSLTGTTLPAPLTTARVSSSTVVSSRPFMPPLTRATTAVSQRAH